MNENRTFGVEMEMASKVSAAEMAQRLTEAFALAGINHQASSSCYTHNTDGANRTVWVCKPDSSINTSAGFPHKMEVVSPVLKGRDGMAALKLVCGYITNKRLAKINTSCGLHVHHGVREDELVPAIKAWKKIEDTVYEAMPPSRKFNHFCRKLSMRVDDLTSYAALRSRWLARENSRYRGFNLESYWMRGTIEFRCAAGTHEFLKVRNWVLVTQMVIDRAVAGATFSAGIDALCAVLNGAAPAAVARPKSRPASRPNAAILGELYDSFTDAGLEPTRRRLMAHFAARRPELKPSVVYDQVSRFLLHRAADLAAAAANNAAGADDAPEYPAVAWLRGRHQQFRLAA